MLRTRRNKKTSKQQPFQGKSCLHKSNFSRSKSCLSASVRVGCSLGSSAERRLVTLGISLVATIQVIGMPFLISSQSRVLFLSTTVTLLLPSAICQGSINSLHIYPPRERRQPLLQHMSHHIHLVTI